MKTLVVPDIHNKIDVVQKILDKESSVDEVIFLGDWFDDFNDNVNDVVEVAKFLNSIYTEENFKFVWGNHDLYYPPFRNFHLCSPDFLLTNRFALKQLLILKYGSNLIFTISRRIFFFLTQVLQASMTIFLKKQNLN